MGRPPAVLFAPMGGGLDRGVDDAGTGASLVVGPLGIGRSTALRDLADRWGATVVHGLASVADIRRLTLSRLCHGDLSMAETDDAIGAVRTAVDGPVVVDDAQDVDTESLEVLLALAAERRVVLGWRSDVPIPDALGATPFLPVTPLAPEEAEDLARANGADDPAAAAHRSGGVPGLLLTICRDGDLTAHRRSLAATIASLPPAAARGLAMLRAADGGGVPDDAIEEVDALVQAGFAEVDSSEVRCRHGLAAEVAWDALDDGSRRSVRGDLASLASDPLVVLTQQLALGETDGAIDRARSAIADVDPRRASRLASLVAEHSGAPNDHLVAAAAAVRFTDAPAAQRHVAAMPAGAELVTAQTLRLSGDLAAAGRALVSGSTTGGAEHDAERAVVSLRSNAAVEPAPAPPPSPTAEVLHRLLSGADVRDDAVALARDAESDGDLDTAVTAHVAVLASSLVAADPDGAEALARLVGLGHDTGAPLAIAARRLQPALRFHLGSAGTDVAEALAELDGPVAAVHVVLALAHAGRTGDAADLLVPDRWPDTPVWRSVVAWLQAEVALLAGRLVSCRNAAAEARRTVPGTFPTVDLAALVDARAAAEADGVGGVTVGTVGTSGSIVAPFVDAELAALESPADVAADRFDTAAAGWRGRHHPSDLRCRMAAARCRLPDPGGVAAMEALVVEADALGYRVLASGGRRELRRSGVHGRASGGERGGTLSPREREVLGHVAEGASSREIGNLLGVAASTVDTQVKSAMQKLGARTRLQAASMAAEL